MCLFKPEIKGEKETVKFDPSQLDLGLFLIINLFNLLTTVILLARTRGMAQLELNLGLINVAMIIPVGAIIILNYMNQREWWTTILPLSFLAFLVLELILDYVLKLNFRQTQLLWPYLTSFYISQFAMIGFSFLANKQYGYTTLVTYFILLLATLYTRIKGFP
jgi:hypothetical protein